MVHPWGLRLSAQDPWRPLVVAAVLLAIRLALFRGVGPFGRTWRQLLAELGAREDPARAMYAPMPARRELVVAGAALAVVLGLVFHEQLADFYGVPDFGDPLFSMWRLSWVTHQIVSDPRHLFDANIFFPDPATLTYSDSVILPALTVAPLLWLGVHPAVAYTLVFMSGFFLSALAAYVFARVIGLGVPGAWMAALLFCLFPYRIDHYSHLELQMAQWMPMALLATARLMTTGRRRYAVILGLLVAAQWYSSMYYGMFLMLYVAVFAAVLAIAWRAGWRGLAWTAAGLVLALVLTAPLVSAYVAGGPGRGTRPVDAIRMFSATPRDYLQPHHRSAAYTWTPERRHPERDVFPGLVSLGLAAAGAIPPLSATRLAILTAGVVAFDGSLGLNGHWYPLAFTAFPPLQSVRVPARFTILVGLSLALLSGAGVSRLWRRLRSPAAQRVALGLLTVLAMIEATPILDLKPVWRRPPSIYGALGAESRAVLFELPMRDNPDWFEENIPYMYFSIWHWTRMVNGYSGFLPMQYRRLTAETAGFPEGTSVDYLLREGVTHVTLHCALWNGESCTVVARRLDGDPRFRLVANAQWQGKPVRLYALVR